MPMLLAAARPLLLDLLATFIFAGAAALTHSLLLAAGLALAGGLAQLAWSALRRRPVGALQWVSLALVVVFGCASLVTHDPRVLMFKPTLVYALVGAAMLEPGWMRRYVPPAALARLPTGRLAAWGYAWAGLMGLTAALNAAFALFAGVAAWAGFMAVFPLASKSALFAVQYAAMRAEAVRRARAGASQPAPAAA